MDISVLRQLQSELELTDAQLAALPPLPDIDLISQNDSHLIEHLKPTPSTYHSYKLFIGVEDNDYWHIYLRTTGIKRPYSLKVCSVNCATKQAHSPYDGTYYGGVKNLAYPFNAFLAAQWFIAVVKWYFLHGLRRKKRQALYEEVAKRA